MLICVVLCSCSACCCAVGAVWKAGLHPMTSSKIYKYKWMTSPDGFDVLSGRSKRFQHDPTGANNTTTQVDHGKEGSNGWNNGKTVLYTFNNPYRDCQWVGNSSPRPPKLIPTTPPTLNIHKTATNRRIFREISRVYYINYRKNDEAISWWKEGRTDGGTGAFTLHCCCCYHGPKKWRRAGDEFDIFKCSRHANPTTRLTRNPMLASISMSLGGRNRLNSLKVAPHTVATLYVLSLLWGIHARVDYPVYVILVTHIGVPFCFSRSHPTTW